MSKNAKYDLTLFCVTFLLVALGLIMVFSASQVIGREKFSSSYFFMQQHAIRVAVGLCCLFVFTRIPFNVYRGLSVWILTVGILLLVALFIWGKDVRGARRWLEVFTFMLQPVEVVKFALVIYIAARIADGKKKARHLTKGFLPLIGVIILIAVLVGLQPNLSNAFLIVIMSLVLMFVGGSKLNHLASFGGATLAVAATVMYSFPHVRNRLSAFMDAGLDVYGQGWQVKQSLIAIGSGFLFGCGPGSGHQKYSFLPDAHTDFIYSIIGEELGLAGTVLVLVLFVILFQRAICAARRSTDDFGYMLAIGIGLVIFSTALVNISMTLGLVPVAGLPLPFVSYGGSSLVTSMSAIGILLRISSSGRDRNDVIKQIRNRTPHKIYARRVVSEKAISG